MYLDKTITRAILALAVLVCCSSEIVKNRTEKATMAFNADCVEFGGIDNGVTTKIDTGNIQALHIECNPGFDLIGRPKVLCNDGHWENIPRPQCSKRCPPPPFMLNAEIVIEGRKDDEGRYRKSSLATYKCGPGFHLFPETSQYRVCKDGIWTGNHGSCVSDGCDRPADIAYGYYVLKSLRDQNNSPPDGRVSVGQRAHYSCNLGYALSGPEILQCIDTGGWSPRLPPQCDKLATEAVVVEGSDDGSCATLPAAPHTTVATIQGQQTANNAPAGTALEIRCKPGYRDTRYPCEAATLSCVGGVWQGRLPSCVEVDGCQSPPNIDHGALFGLATDGHYQINAEVAYTCQKGYFLDGDPILTCQPDGCWQPEALPKCMSDSPGNPFFAADYITTSNTLIVSLATALAAMLILFGMGVCLVVVCRRHRRLGMHRSQSTHHRQRRASNPALSQPPGVGVANSSALLHDPDRVALIAFADGVQLGESLLPSYEEAIREQRGNVIGSAGLLGCRTLRPHWGPPRRSRGPGSSNGDAHVTRQSSSTSHSASLRSGGDSMGSTDTMAPSDVSTNVTLDTVSSHTCSSGSQSASCRAMYGSLASFDTSSILNTEGVPLLEENEMEEGVMGSTPGLVAEQQVQENGSFKYRRASPDLA